jgi:hypothetical protein
MNVIIPDEGYDTCWRLFKNARTKFDIYVFISPGSCIFHEYESKIIYNLLEASKPKGPKQDSQDRLWPPMPEEKDERYFF